LVNHGKPAKKGLDISADGSLILPIDAVVTEKQAWLGISGSGKTYGVGKCVEELLEARAQVVIVDTVGNWYGLRLAADGKREGIPIPILGGERGDVPLDPLHGKLVAETVALTKASMIVDVSDFTDGELRRFVTAFASELLHLKKRNKSPVVIVWEECQDIVPQIQAHAGGREAAVVVGAVQRLIKRGRNYGIGTILISQRAAAVNKDVLNQCGTLFCFRQVAVHDRKAIENWIVSKSLNVKELVAELPELPTGTCFCWSPEWLKVLQKVRIGKKRTFDSTKTPEFGGTVEAGKLAEVDLEKFKRTMGDAIERAKADDPKALRARIAELERQAKAKAPAPAPVPKAPKVQRVEVPVLLAADRKLITRASDHAEAACAKAAELAKAVSILSARIGRACSEVPPGSPRLSPGPAGTGQCQNCAKRGPTYRCGNCTWPNARAHDARAHGYEVTAGGTPTTWNRMRAGLTNGTPIAGAAPKAPPSRTTAKGVPPARQKILNGLAFVEQVLGSSDADRDQLAFLSEQSPSSSSYANHLGALRSANLIDYPSNGRVALTEGGRGIAVVENVPTTSTELHAMMQRRLPPARWKIIATVIDAYPADVDRSELAERSEQSPTSSAYANHLGALRSLGLLDYPRKGRVIATPALFLEGR
jgi:Helicase HerA, central domain